jgi:predicted nucleic acid-binding protein
MATLVDTCVLLRAFDANYPDYRDIRQALRRALDDKERLVVTVQNIAEFWNAATRPLENNGQGLSAERAKRRVGIIERICEVVSEDNVSYAEWKRLVEDYAVTGVSVHDARLVSVMLRLGIKQILTLNERHFKRYAGEGIAIAAPQSFSGKPS